MPGAGRSGDLGGSAERRRSISAWTDEEAYQVGISQRRRGRKEIERPIIRRHTPSLLSPRPLSYANDFTALVTDLLNDGFWGSGVGDEHIDFVQGAYGR